MVESRNCARSRTSSARAVSGPFQDLFGVQDKTSFDSRLVSVQTRTSLESMSVSSPGNDKFESSGEDQFGVQGRTSFKSRPVSGLLLDKFGV